MPETTNNLSRALRQLDLLEDYCDMFDRLVDMSDIGTFGDELAGPTAPGIPDTTLGASRAYVYPSATSVAYINETEFRWIRARSRAFLAVNPYAAGAVRNRVAYTVGSGHTYDVVSRNRRVGQAPGHPLAGRSEDPPSRSNENADGGSALGSSFDPPYTIQARRLADCRAVLAEFCRVNRWPQRQKETVRRLDRDGERFLRFFPDVENGILRVRFVEPLEIQNPPGATAAEGWFYGIRFARHGGGLDMETPLEYSIVDINPQGSVTELRETVPAADIQRLTANVDLSSPRGLPVFYALQGHLTDAVRTLKATGRIVEFRARIAMIRRHVNATRETIQRATELDGIPHGEPCTDRDGRPYARTARMYPYAAIIDASDATDYQFPSEAAPVDKNVAAIQAELRAAAAALGMPEYMLSGDASNANYSSTMVAEGPAVKTFEEMQAALIEADVEVMERSLVVAAAAGRIAGASADDVLDLVSVQAEPPLIKSENRLQEVQADQILLASGVMSRATFAARNGLVYAEEKERMEE